MELLGERPAWSMGGSELLSTLDALEAELARLEAYRLTVVAAVESTGYAAELGARDTAELLRFRYRQDAPVARRTLRLAQALEHYPAVASALAETAAAPASDGPDDRAAAGWSLRPAQANAIVSALERVPSHVPIADRDAAEEQLVKLAAHLSPTELRRAGNQMRDILDTDGPEPEEHKADARESLTLTPADRGVKFTGFLANENAELLRAVIHAGARPHKTADGELDPRPRDKRQADALTTALTIAAAAWDTNSPAEAEAANSGGPGGAGNGRVPGYGAKANITVTIDLDDLKAATADAIGRTVYSDGLSAATVRRLACDANVIPLVLGSNSEPLDVGRRERLVTRAMRRALNARDRGCVVCGAPPVMCDAHHLISWIDGGETKIANLALLCRRHHTDLHNGQWSVTITDGTVQVTRPRWADADPEHPHHFRRRTVDPEPDHPAPPLTTPVGTLPAALLGAPPAALLGAPPSAPLGGPPTAPSGTPLGGGEVVSGGRRSRWRADGVVLREAGEFELAGPLTG